MDYDIIMDRENKNKKKKKKDKSRNVGIAFKSWMGRKQV